MPDCQVNCSLLWNTMAPEQKGRQGSANINASVSKSVKKVAASSERYILLICAILCSLIFLFDVSTMIGFIVSILYLIPIIIASWSPKRRTMYLVAVASSILTVIAVPLKPPGDIQFAFFNRPVSLIAIWLAVLLEDRYISKQKRVEEALRESERRLRIVLDNSLDGINMLDLATGRYVVFSPAQVELTGFTADELNGISAEEAYQRTYPDDREVTIAQQRRVAAGEDIREPVEYRWKVKGGEYRWFSDKRKLVRDERGSPSHWLGSAGT